MKKLLIAASMAAGLAAGAMPAFAQSASQYPAPAQNYNQTQNYAQVQNYTRSPNYDPPAATSGAPHVGTGSDQSYQMQQHELQNSPGYSIAR
jgi:hypothetical protein